MSEPIVGIDVGTTKVCTLIAERNERNGHLRIIGVGVAPSRGLKKGVVVNTTEATAAIKESKEKAERSSGYVIEGAFVGVAGDHIASVNSKGVVSASHGARGISEEDVARALESARAIAIPTNREVIHVIPRGYTLDSVEGVHDPVGMQGFRLEVEAHIVTGALPAIHNLINCVEAAGVTVNDLVLEPIAAGEAVLHDDEKEAGVVLVDVGGGTTDIAIFIDGSIWHSQVLPIGGWQYTNDLTIGLRAPFNVAEAIKLQHGSVCPEVIAEGELVDVASFGDNGHRPIARREVAHILQARAEEMCALILKEIKRSGYDGLLPAGIVLTGGTAELNGLAELGRESLKLPVRIGSPQGLEGLTDTVSRPMYATSVGLLWWGLRYAKLSTHSKEHEPRSPLKRASEWIKRLFPQ
jgi:cell division protein FtsA